MEAIDLFKEEKTKWEMYYSECKQMKRKVDNNTICLLYNIYLTHAVDNFVMPPHQKIRGHIVSLFSVCPSVHLPICIYLT